MVTEEKDYAVKAGIHRVDEQLAKRPRKLKAVIPMQTKNQDEATIFVVDWFIFEKSIAQADYMVGPDHFPRQTR
ncbi:MAG: hypothetical protein ALECFALPRED_005396 [Alectoria fallacina]|uniref:Uncharacterized protein n=1 Tax=Alectoria fallacina TaxID=1903189 RepID=A0A8H3FZC1_9LECA|nr:MAG: hypothetical protein ALECFALPRED_005396 [Alectoria fallacina]